MNPKYEKAYLKFREWAPWLIGGLAVLSANWAASAFYETVQVWEKGTTGVISPLRIGYIVFFIIMVVLFYRQRNVLFRPHTRLLTNEPAEKRKHLVLFLSSLPESLKKINGVPEGLNLVFDDVNKDIGIMEKKKETGIRWSWEMPLRAIRHHLERPLETVTLICSKESFPQAPLFLGICRKYNELRNAKFYTLGQKSHRTELICLSSPDIVSNYQGLDFESFDELSRTLWILLKEFKKRGYSEHDTMIDFTGGQKVTSVVAATMTFNRKIKAQYIQTNSPWDVLSYDVTLGFSDTGRFGI